MTVPVDKRRKTNSVFGGILRRFGLGLLRDFLRVGIVFVVLFVLIMLHITHTVEIAPLNWLLARSTNLEQPAPLPVDETKNHPLKSDQSTIPSVETEHTEAGASPQTVPNLLP